MKNFRFKTHEDISNFSAKNFVQKIKCKKFSAKNLVQKILVQEFERDLSCDSICKKLKLSIQSKLSCNALKFSFLH